VNNAGETMEEFEARLDALLAQRREAMKTKYNRVLPTGELLFDRYKKAEYLQAGQDSSVYDTSVIMGDIKIGEHVWIGPYTLIEGINGMVTIGDFVSINSGVMIFTHDSTKYYVSGGKNPFKKGDVHIGSNTVIGSMSMIGCNVEIGSRCVVAAGSVVTKSIPDCTIVGGNPAIRIGQVCVLQDGTVEFEYD
jgi:acetyltransferase-like isoleucine patch superfamily enzyme